ncbi:MAG: hypothetical protein MUF50_03180, partial [Planctomycetes bacterium]|nr:hypothetical protein [Planctomycetota bacterium]
MDNLLLEKIIKEKKTEELARLNAITIVDKLFAELMDREKDVLSRRFGLYGNDKHTLEEIGTIHKLTRERVRQIEAASIKKLKKIEKLEEYISGLKNSIDSIVKEHGGFVRKEYLLDIMTVLSHDLNGDHTDSTYKNHVDFIVSKILDDQFDRIDNSEYFNSYFKVKDHETAHFENIAKELVNKVDDFKKTLTTEELLDLVKRLESYDKNQGEINKYGSNLDLTDIFKSEVFPDKGELINENKITYSLLQA